MNVTFDYKFGAFLIPKSYILHSSKYFFSLIPPNPILKGHLILCSKREVKFFSDLNNEEIFDFSLTLQYISKMLENYYNVSSCTISIQEGDECGQSISHFHCHVIPRSIGDLTDNDYIYTKIQYFDEEFVKEYTSLQSNLKNQLILKEEAERLKESFLRNNIF